MKGSESHVKEFLLLKDMGSHQRFFRKERSMIRP